MTDLIQINSSANPSELNEVYISPDFSAFNKPVLSWSVRYSYSAEAHFTIEFAGLPLYNNTELKKAQLVTIELQDIGPINMYVRNIHYTLNDESVITVVTLKTAMIFLDQYPSGSLNLGSEKTVESVFKGILNALQLPSGFINNNPLNWPSIAEEITINGTETILDWINSQLGKRVKRKSKNPLNDKEPVFDWWFDIKNNLRVEPKFTESSQTFDLNLDSIRPIYVSLDVEIADKVEKRNVPSEINKDTPAQTAVVRSVTTDAAGTQGTITSERITINDDNTVEQSFYQNALVETKSVGLKLKGLHWLPEHEKLTLTNFPIGNGAYIIESIDLTHNALGAFTTLELKAFELAMPRKESDADDEVDNTKKPRTVTTNSEGTQAVIQ